jgi:hypothetical protein
VRALQDLAKHLGKQPKAKRRLSFVHWLVAFDRYALTADACDQWEFVETMAHKCICTQVAMQAPLKNNRRNLLGVFYDEVARDAWSKLAYNGSHSFDVNVACRKLDEGLLHQAECLYDQVLSEQSQAKKNFQQPSAHDFQGTWHGGKGKAKGSDKSGGKGKRACYICGDPDHLANQCQQPHNTQQVGEHPGKRHRK